MNPERLSAVTLMARGGQQRVAEQMAEVPGKGHLLWDFLANEARSYLLPIEYLGKLRTPGLEKITDRSPMKLSVIKEGEQSEWGAREAGDQCWGRGVWKGVCVQGPE